jgi:hypothetical protein
MELKHDLTSAVSDFLVVLSAKYGVRGSIECLSTPQMIIGSFRAVVEEVDSHFAIIPKIKSCLISLQIFVTSIRFPYLFCTINNQVKVSLEPSMNFIRIFAFCS